MELSLLSPLIVGFVWAFNGLGIPKKYSPFIAVGIGVAIAYSLNEHWIQGVIAGFTAVGLWSAGKSTVETVNK